MTESKDQNPAENVYQAIVKVMSRVAGFKKEYGEAPYPVKLEVEVIRAVREHMIAEGLVLAGTGISDVEYSTREVQTRRGSRSMEVYKATFHYQLHHAPSETYVTLAVPGSGMHSEDKAPYIAKTGSKKYALSDIFLLESWDEDPDDYYYGNEESSSDESPEEEDDAGEGPPGEDALDMYYALVATAQKLEIVVEPLSDGITLAELREEYEALGDLVQETQETTTTTK